MSLKPDLITLDFSLPDLKGDALFKKIRDVNPTVPVIMISSQEDISVAVNLLKMGVSDYLIKDEATKDLLWNSILRIRETQSLKKLVKKTQAEWWTINFYSGDRFCFNITLKTKDLRSIINKNNFNKVPGGDNNTSWGYLVPIIKLIDFILLKKD